MRFLVILTLLCSFWSMTMSAQDVQDRYEQEKFEKKQLDRREWKKIKERIDYGRAEKRSGEGSFGMPSRSGGKGSTHEKGDPERAPKEKPKKKQDSSGGVSNLTVFIAILALAVVIGFLIYRLLINSKISKNAKVKGEVDEDERSPQEIPKSELELSLERAIGEENYREAIRIYFIFIIKELSEQGLIKWEKEKTNMAYQNELIDRPEHKLFSKVTYFFEYVWYGEHNIGRRQYEKLEPEFKSLLNQLDRTGK